MNPLIAVLVRGVEVANPEAWKTGQITGTILGGFILCLINAAHAYGCPLVIDTAQATEIGGAVITVFNIVMTAATSKHIGIVESPASNSGHQNESDHA